MFKKIITICLFFVMLAISFYSNFYFQERYETLKNKNNLLEKKIAESYEDEKLFRNFGKNDILKVFLLCFLFLIAIVILILVNIKIKKFEEEHEELVK